VGLMTDMLFTSTEDLERRVRSSDPDSSWAAANIAPAAASELQRFILVALGTGDLTDDELFSLYRDAGGNRTPQRLRTERAALSNPKRGPRQIQEATEMGLSAAGHPARRWTLIGDAHTACTPHEKARSAGSASVSESDSGVMS